MINPQRNISMVWVLGLGPNSAPSNLAATVISDTQINLSLTRNDSNGDGIKVYQAINGGAFSLREMVIGVGVNTYNATGLTQAYIYDFKITVYKGTKETDYSNTTRSLTLPTAFVGGVANTKRWVFDDLSTITKDSNNYISLAAEKYSSGQDLAPISTYKPLWTGEGVKMITSSGKNTVLRKDFTLVKPYEIYTLAKIPTWAANNVIIGTGASVLTFIRQSGTTPQSLYVSGFNSDKINFPLNAWHVASAQINSTYATDKYGVDDGTEVTGNFSSNEPGGITVGGYWNGSDVYYGITDSIYNEVVVRNIKSSDTDRAAIKRFLMYKAAFFLT